MEMEERISALYSATFGCLPGGMEKIQACGSDRRYFRVSGPGREFSGLAPKSLIACWNADKKENAAFVSFARSFRKAGLPVPEIYAVDEANDIYLQQDLGGESLYDRVKAEWLDTLDSKGDEAVFPEPLKRLYCKVLSQLVRLQLTGREVIDFSLCTPCPAFHRDAIHWDLNYFKYFFLKLMRVPFDEQALEDDFRSFSSFLLEETCDYFLYRDFQSANIMLLDDEPFFIDFQGGRRGALQYDPASLLFDAKTRLPRTVREELTDFYYEELVRQLGADKAPSKQRFMGHSQAYTLCRLLQALAAFGLRGLVEHKAGFAESIPPAVDMVNDILSDWRIPVELPELKACLKRLNSVAESL